MKRRLAFALRLALIVTFLALLPAAFGPRSGSASPSPYASALSALAGGDALAAPSTCGNTGCNRLGHCSKAHGSNCRYAGGECTQSAC